MLILLKKVEHSSFENNQLFGRKSLGTVPLALIKCSKMENFRAKFFMCIKISWEKIIIKIFKTFLQTVFSVRNKYSFKPYIFIDLFFNCVFYL